MTADLQKIFLLRLCHEARQIAQAQGTPKISFNAISKERKMKIYQVSLNFSSCGVLGLEVAIQKEMTDAFMAGLLDMELMKGKKVEGMTLYIRNNLRRKAAREASEAWT